MSEEGNVAQGMTLSRIVLVNWSGFSYESLCVPRSGTVIAGHNYCGKTTILDALQVVYQGRKDGSIFNAAASESATRARTYDNYCLGRKPDSNMQGLREGRTFTTHIAIEVEDLNGIGYWTAGVATDFENGKRIRERFYTYRGRLAEDAIVKDGVISDLGELGENLRDLAEAGKISDIELFEKLRDYRSSFMRLANMTSDEILKTAADYAKGPGRRKMSEFIKNCMTRGLDYISLDEVNERIEGWADAEEKLHSLKGDIEILEEEIEAWEEKERRREKLLVDERAEALRNAMRAKVKHEKAVKRETEAAERLTVLDEKTAVAEERIEEIEEKLDRARAIRDGGNVGELQRDMAYKKRQVEDLENRIARSYSIMSRLANCVDQTLESENLPNDVRKSLVEIARQCEKIDEYGQGVFLEAPELADGLAPAVDDAIRKMRAARDVAAVKSADLKQRERELGDERDSLAAVRVGGFTRNTTRALGLLREISGRPIHVLADIIEIAAPERKWSAVIESWMGADRETLIVAPEDYDEVARALASAKPTLSKEGVRPPRIPNIGSIEMNEKRCEGCEEGSIAAKLRTEYSYVQSYLNFRYGRDIAFEKEDDFFDYTRETARARACTLSGMSYKDYSLSYLDQRKGAMPLIGSTSRARAADTRIAELHSEIEKAKAKGKRAEQAEAVLSQALAALHAHSSDGEGTLSRKAAASDAERAQQLSTEIDELEAIIAKAYSSDQASAAKRCEELTELCRREKSDLKALYDARSETSANLKMAQEDIRRLTAKLDEAESALSALPEPSEEIEAAAREKAGGKEEIDVEGCRSALAKAARKVVMQRVGVKSRMASLDADVEMEGNEPWQNEAQCIRQRYMPKAEEDFAHAKKALHDECGTAVFNRLRESFVVMRMNLRDNNKALSSVEFDGRQYKFNMKVREECQEFHRLITSAECFDYRDSLFEGAFYNEYQEIIDEFFEPVFRMTKGFSDAEKADCRKEAQLRVDPTSYFNFDLIRTNTVNGEKEALAHGSEMGSGGEQEIPFHLIHLLSLANQLKTRDRNPAKRNTLRTVFIDEAFKNSDDDKVSKMMDIIEDCGLQPVMVFPTGSKAERAFRKTESIVAVMKEDSSDGTWFSAVETDKISRETEELFAEEK